jgi:hypothetical protein
LTKIQVELLFASSVQTWVGISPKLRPQPAVDSVHTPKPRAINLKALTCLLASAKIGDDTRRPTCRACSSSSQAGPSMKIPMQIQPIDGAVVAYQGHDMKLTRKAAGR